MPKTLYDIKLVQQNEHRKTLNFFFSQEEAEAFARRSSRDCGPGESVNIYVWGHSSLPNGQLFRSYDSGRRVRDSAPHLRLVGSP